MECLLGTVFCNKHEEEKEEKKKEKIKLKKAVSEQAFKYMNEFSNSAKSPCHPVTSPAQQLSKNSGMKHLKQIPNPSPVAAFALPASLHPRQGYRPASAGIPGRPISSRCVNARQSLRGCGHLLRLTYFQEISRRFILPYRLGAAHLPAETNTGPFALQKNKPTVLRSVAMCPSRESRAPRPGRENWL